MTIGEKIKEGGFKIGDLISLKNGSSILIGNATMLNRDIVHDKAEWSEEDPREIECIVNVLDGWGTNLQTGV